MRKHKVKLKRVDGVRQHYWKNYGGGPKFEDKLKEKGITLGLTPDMVKVVDGKIQTIFDENMLNAAVNELGIREPTATEKKQFRRIFEKRPELLEDAKGLNFEISDKTQLYITAHSNQPPKGPGEEMMIIDSQTLKENPKDVGEQIEMKEKLKGTGMDWSGSTIAHDLQHRKDIQNMTSSELTEHAKAVNSLSMDVFAGKKTISEAEQAYKELPLEKRGFAKQLQPRARDIKVPEEKIEEGFREVFK